MINWRKRGEISAELVFHSVRKKLPDRSQSYLVRCDNACIGGTVKQLKIMYFSELHGVWSTDSFDGRVTHWAELPNAK